MNFSPPFLFINFKTYEQATGQNALRLAKAAEEVSVSQRVSILLVAQPMDLRLLSERISLPVFAQHIDPVEYGANTGKILPEAVKRAGAIGAVLNHAEDKQSNDVIERSLARAKEVSLQTLVCAETVERAREIASMNPRPEFIAVEPPELIGGTVSVSTARPELIVNSLNAVKEQSPGIRVLVGAGVNKASDAEKAVRLGAAGVFVASAIVKALNQKRAIEEIAQGLRKAIS